MLLCLKEQYIVAVCVFVHLHINMPWESNTRSVVPFMKVLEPVPCHANLPVRDLHSKASTEGGFCHNSITIGTHRYSNSPRELQSWYLRHTQLVNIVYQSTLHYGNHRLLPTQVIKIVWRLARGFEITEACVESEYKRRLHWWSLKFTN